VTAAPCERSGERRSPPFDTETAYTGNARPSDSISPTAGVFLALVLFATVDGLLLARNHPALFDGALWGPDSYMWLDRVRLLWNGAHWFDHVYPRIDPPAGFVSHWTRPMDTLLLAGSWALAPMLGFDRALFWWGAATGPLLFLATAIAAIWAAKPLLPRQALWLAPLILATQPAMMAAFAAGRPDHQSLLTFFFILILGAALRMALAPARPTPAVSAALFSALALWTSVQILPLIGAAVAGLSLAWLLGQRDVARCLVVYFAVLCFGLMGALLMEYGLAALTPRPTDTLSPNYLVLFGLLLLFWIGATALRKTDGRGRVFYCLLGGGAFGAALWILSPEFFTQPVGVIDPLYRATHLARIRELQPTIVLVPGAGWLEQIATPALRLGIALPAILYLLYRLLKSRGKKRHGWGMLAIAAVLYSTMAMLQLRWTNFAILTVLIPYVGLVYDVASRVTDAVRRFPIRQVVRPAVTALACVWPFAPGLLVQSHNILPGNGNAHAICRPQEPARILADPKGLGAYPDTVLAFPDYGPELLYRTPHSVLSIPNHRPQPGYTLTFRIMSESDPNMALALLRERGIGFVLICIGSAEGGVYKPTGKGPSLYQRLAAAAPPAGLQPVAIPENEAGGFRLFKVEPGKD